MTVAALDGPQITVGWEPPLGTANQPAGVAGLAPYVTGKYNPDAGPNVYYDGVAVKDGYYRYLEGGGYLQPGGYPNQAIGYLSNFSLTAALTPSTIAAANIAALSAPSSGVALPLVSVSGAGITVVAAAITVLNTGKVVPAGVVQIDAAPAWVAFGESGAVKGWNGNAVGRAVSLTSGSNLSGINFTIRGYDLFGNPQSEILVGPSTNTVNSLKCYKWIASVTPDNTSVNTVSVGTADVFGFPLKTETFASVLVWFDENLITSKTGYTAAVTTSPATQLTGDTRGKYATQSATDGSKKLHFMQRMSANNLNTYPPALGMYGVVPA